jgi:hypothetical protein
MPRYFLIPLVLLALLAAPAFAADNSPGKSDVVRGGGLMCFSVTPPKERRGHQRCDQLCAARGAVCVSNSTNAGMVQWTGIVLEYCNGLAWTPFKRCTETAYTALSAYPGCCGTTNAVYSDGTYIYNADTSTGLLAYTFNGSSFTNVATQSIQTQGFYGVTKGGSTIFTASRARLPLSQSPEVGRADDPSGKNGSTTACAPATPREARCLLVEHPWARDVAEPRKAGQQEPKLAVAAPHRRGAKIGRCSDHVAF